MITESCTSQQSFYHNEYGMAKKDNENKESENLDMDMNLRNSRKRRRLWAEDLVKDLDSRWGHEVMEPFSRLCVEASNNKSQ